MSSLPSGFNRRLGFSDDLLEWQDDNPRLLKTRVGRIPIKTNT
jgi:hypothetical protein